jgi:hypothetical protein
VPEVQAAQAGEGEPADTAGADGPVCGVQGAPRDAAVIWFICGVYIAIIVHTAYVYWRRERQLRIAIRLIELIESERK